MRRLTEVQRRDLDKHLSSGAVLDWRGEDLSETDLSNINLRGVDLSKADLSKANLRGTNLREVNLQEANLQEANYMNEASLRRVNLSKANLYKANLSGAVLIGATLREANLQEADLRRANLREADLSGANLSGTKFDNPIYAYDPPDPSQWHDCYQMLYSILPNGEVRIICGCRRFTIEDAVSYWGRRNYHRGEVMGNKKVAIVQEIARGVLAGTLPG